MAKQVRKARNFMKMVLKNVLQHFNLGNKWGKKWHKITCGMKERGNLVEIFKNLWFFSPNNSYI